MSEETNPNAQFVSLDSDDGYQRILGTFRYSLVGRSVNSVTHDVNNILGAIMAYGELLGMEPDLSDEGRRMSSEIVGGVKRCSDLISSLTSVARRERNVATLADPSALIERATLIRAYDIKLANISLKTDFPANQASLMADVPKLEMCVLALLTNALEALEATEGEKVISISSRVEDNQFVCTFQDSAPPIPEPIQDTIFEPFFTSKSERHLGLGLTLARGYAELHEGTLTYMPDRGFILTLPLNNTLFERYGGNKRR